MIATYIPYVPYNGSIVELWFRVLINVLSCSAVLAHIILRERLHIFGILGCALCVVGSTTIVLHAPQERPIESVTEVWDLAMEPGNSSCFLHLPYEAGSFLLFTLIHFVSNAQ